MAKGMDGFLSPEAANDFLKHIYMSHLGQTSFYFFIMNRPSLTFAHTKNIVNMCIIEISFL